MYTVYYITVKHNLSSFLRLFQLSNTLIEVKKEKFVLVSVAM